MSTRSDKARLVSRFYEQCDEIGVEPSAQDKIVMEELLEAEPRLKSLGFDFDEAMRSGQNIPAGGGQGAGGPGDLFIRSAEFKSIGRKGARDPSWSTEPVEIPRAALQYKGTVMEGVTPGGGPWVQPDTRTGVVSTLYQQLTIADALNTEMTTSNVVRTIWEGTVTPAAAATGEGSAKPEATIPFVSNDYNVRKIAVFLPISDEMLSDAPQVQSYLNQRLSLYVQNKEEVDLLRGDGTGVNLLGLLNAGIQTFNAASTADELYAIRQMITKARTSFLEPTFVMCHPNQSEHIDLQRDTTGQYLRNPFTGGAATVWGIPLITTQNIGAGTVLVGSRLGATIYRNGGLSVTASNSHSDFFQRDLVAVRAEVREALAVLRPSAFVMGTAFA